MGSEYYAGLGNLPTVEVLSKIPFKEFLQLVRESNTDAEKRLLTLEEVMAVTKLKKSRIYELMAEGEFPRQQRNTGGQGRRAMWQAEKVYNWCAR